MKIIKLLLIFMLTIGLNGCYGYIGPPRIHRRPPFHYTPKPIHHRKYVKIIKVYPYKIIKVYPNRRIR